ncbi:dGTPase [Serratia marcescens]|uniref:dGTPase n=1 Tax=Serratia marcescens TaxID=615 RepID=UPI001FD5A9DB|nr:dGTPase [Serratia marcescens]UOO25290.1 dGTPase [Serratia marcescens]HBB9121586.1 dGTPase [Serratia marcescens]
MTDCILEKTISYKKVDTRTKYELEDAFISDKGRLIYSAPFRRMQQKAQVFSLESNSAVRSRLSHSLEVAHIGDYIVHAITKELRKSNNGENKDKTFWLNNEKSIKSIVETTCLMHDIGNPPFGHFGESTISDWFKNKANLTLILRKSGLLSDDQKIDEEFENSIQLRDFTSFDGNPQAIRIVTKLQGDDGVTGLNFTYTQIAASLKYTYGGSNYKKIKENHLTSKIGYFSTEEDIVKKTWQELSIPENCRHPLTFIMEAADDISYCTSDIEDGIEKGIVTDKELYEFIKKRISLNSPLYDEDVRETLAICDGHQRNEKISQFTEFKTTLSRLLVKKAADNFLEDFDNIMQFRKTEPLLVENNDNKDITAILSQLKSFTKEFIFSSSEVEMTELSGHSIISGILNCYSPLLEIKHDDFIALTKKEKSPSISKVAVRLYRTLPEKYLRSYIKNTDGTTCIHSEWNLRAHLIIDFISGMTDQYALELYQSLTGIKVK